jgi:hypothetical protein
MREGHGPELWGRTQDVDETASVTGGNFRTIRETNKVVVAIRTKFAVEEFTGGDLKWLNELSRLDFSFFFFFFFFFVGGKKARNAYEPYDDQIAVLDFYVFGPHLAWLLKRRKRLLYTAGKEGG